MRPTFLALTLLALALAPLPLLQASMVQPGDYVRASGVEMLVVSYPDGATRRSGFSLDPGCADPDLGPCADVVVPLEHGGPAEGPWNITAYYDRPHPMGGEFSISFVIDDWGADVPVTASVTCAIPTQAVHWVLDYEAESWTAKCDDSEIPTWI